MAQGNKQRKATAFSTSGCAVGNVPSIWLKLLHIFTVRRATRSNGLLQAKTQVLPAQVLPATSTPTCRSNHHQSLFTTAVPATKASGNSRAKRYKVRPTTTIITTTNPPIPLSLPSRSAQ
jgi:hypothetical protein